MTIDSDIQKQILTQCKFLASGGKYSQLKSETDIDNDLFNYHLQFLVKKGFLDKNDQLYTLTEKGKSSVTNIDEEIKTITPAYKVSVYMCPIIDNQVLLYKRLKHPQYSYTGLISGKIRYGEPILETAQREFTEETGLTAKFKIIGNLRQIRKNSQGQVIEDGVFYICYTNKIAGTLVPKGPEGEYFWTNLDQVSQLKKIFKPSLEIVITEVQNRISGNVSWDSKFIYELQPEPEDY